MLFIEVVNLDVTADSDLASLVNYPSQAHRPFSDVLLNTDDLIKVGNRSCRKIFWLGFPGLRS